MHTNELCWDPYDEALMMRPKALMMRPKALMMRPEAKGLHGSIIFKVKQHDPEP